MVGNFKLRGVAVVLVVSVCIMNTFIAEFETFVLTLLWWCFYILINI